MFSFLLQGKVGDMMAPIKSPEAQLLIAIQNRQQDKIRELLEVKGVSANFANDRGVRPMHMACQSGDMALVQRLLELGADIVTADNSGNTPLHYASKGGHTDMVKMLVGQGAAVERRNASRLTAYEVATDHVIRQFLLPLQLKAEAGNPEYAVQSMGITSDAPRSYEQYGVPGMAQSNASHGQPYGQPYGQANQPSSSGRDPMSAALGALMQAPTAPPPRPGAYSGTFPSTQPRQPDSFSPPGGGDDIVEYAPSSAALPTPLAMGASPAVPATPSVALPTPGSSSASPPTAASPSVAPFPGPTAVAGASFKPPVQLPVASGHSADSAEGCSVEPAPVPATNAAASPVDSSASVLPNAHGDATAAAAAAAAASTFPGVAVQTQTPVVVESPEAPPKEDPNEGDSQGEDESAGAQQALPLRGESSVAPDGGIAMEVGGHASSGVPSTSLQVEGETPMEPRRPGAAALPGINRFGSGPAMTSVDLSSRFQAQVTVAEADGPLVASGVDLAAPSRPPAHPSSAPSSGQGGTDSLPSRPPGAFTPGPGPHQPAAEKAGKFKPIKADGFHSSASDKALQLRYGHTSIVRDFGAPPTAAQLGGPPTAGPPMGAPPAGAPSMARPSTTIAYTPPGAAAGVQSRPPYQTPQGGYYGQPFGGGGGGMQTDAGQQAFGQAQHTQLPPPPLPTAGHPHMAMHAYAAPPANPSARGDALPVPGGYGYAAGGGGAPPPAFPPAGASDGNTGGGEAGGNGFSVFNPATDRVIAANSTSSAVL